MHKKGRGLGVRRGKKVHTDTDPSHLLPASVKFTTAVCPETRALLCAKYYNISLFQFCFSYSGQSINFTLSCVAAHSNQCNSLVYLKKLDTIFVRIC